MKLKSESFIRVNIRELNGVPVTKYLSYIYLANSLYYTNLAYLKGTCIRGLVLLRLFSFIFFS